LALTRKNWFGVSCRNLVFWRGIDPLFLEFNAMDGTTATTPTFRTPTRILVPKLVKSRDGWKAKALERKKRLKAARIRNRDLEASRTVWRQRAEAAEEQVAALQQQGTPAQQELVALRAENERLREELKKKSTRPR
jgi:hypothetical protein